MSDTQQIKEFIKIQKRVKKWLKEWLQYPHCVPAIQNDADKALNAYLENCETDYKLGSQTDYLSSLHFHYYMQKTFDTDANAAYHLALSARHMHASIKFRENFANLKLGGDVLLDVAANCLAQNIILDWRGPAQTVLRTIYKGLDTPLLNARTDDPAFNGSIYKSFWFVTLLMGQLEGYKINTLQYTCPRDLGPYRAVLADWRTQDLNQVQAYITAMADFHMGNAAYNDEEYNEFDSENVMLFPYEILAFLRIREWAGLKRVGRLKKSPLI
jgi:hypothetical protein